jgi:hypothetical protein
MLNNASEKCVKLLKKGKGFTKLGNSDEEERLIIKAT